MFTRRDFLASGLLSVGAGIVVPPVFAKGVLAATNDSVHNDRVLVILQLAGGNDGLNTVVPYADPAYHDARPQIGIAADKVLRLDNNVGLHPSLPGIKKLYDAGKVAVVQGVGYPNPIYSHFESLDVWQYGDPTRRTQDGWLGRLLASGQIDSQGHPLAACACGEASQPHEMRSSGAAVSVIDSLQSYGIKGDSGRQAAATALYTKTPGVYGALFDQAMGTAMQGISSLQAATTYQPAATYEPRSPVYGSKVDLASSMQLAAQIIVTQPTAKVIHVVLGGFDTHQQQDTRQASLLSYVDTAVSAFMQDLAAHGVDHRVTLATWSEFGRRLAENGSSGTDHGAASPLFLIGGNLQGGLFGEAPSLTALVDAGNLKYTTDFRSVYQSLIRDWLGADAAPVLGGSFPELGLRWS